MSVTLTVLGNDALVDIGVLVPGQTATTDLLNIILRYANRMIDQWRIDKLMALAYPVGIYPLTNLLEQYKIGPGQVSPNINATRPTGISDANVIIVPTGSAPTVRKPLTLWNKDEWSYIRVRATNPGDAAPIAAIPDGLYYDGDFNETSGYATINLWPAPNFQVQSLEIWTQEALPFLAFADVTTAYSFPPGWELCFERCLAQELIAPLKAYMKFDVDLNQVRQYATIAKAEVMSDNAPDSVKYCEPAFRGSSNRRGGWVYGTGDYGRR